MWHFWQFRFMLQALISAKLLSQILHLFFSLTHSLSYSLHGSVFFSSYFFCFAKPSLTPNTQYLSRFCELSLRVCQPLCFLLFPRLIIFRLWFWSCYILHRLSCGGSRFPRSVFPIRFQHELLNVSWSCYMIKIWKFVRGREKNFPWCVSEVQGQGGRFQVHLPLTSAG